MQVRSLRVLLVFAVAIVAANVQVLRADPCGMVPPIYPGQDVPITRIGLQQTYVFYKNGIETIVIRPGFSGKIDDFGMLIPFPTPPAVRKVPDHIFQHLAAAVDPPEVVVDLRPQFYGGALGGGALGKSDKQMLYFDAPVKDAVRVLRQEAVGMYEVAVLEAGSAAALKRWMDDHGYKYPKGMDEPCNDYVSEGWCFVAIKTKVGQKGGVDPKPGQRTVNSKLPAGSTFDGHIQGMGFRFKVDELVVPMRLSAFNKGDLRNVVYLLTDGPQRIRSIPEEYVMRQISGKQLYKHLTELLPLRIIGGTEKQIPEYRRKTLPNERDPGPQNGAAAELFASDLLSAAAGELALPHEEREKELLRIGERFGLRGPEIDKLNNNTLADERAKTVEKQLSGLKEMTLTVVDGDFPRELLGKQNLTFAEYEMPARRNQSGVYDAKLNGPAPKKEGVLKLGALSPLGHDHNSAVIANNVKQQPTIYENVARAMMAMALAVFGLVVARHWRSRGRVSRSQQS